jgi:DNA-binding NarL/FixJ family response regulator
MKPFTNVAFLDTHDVSRHGIAALLAKAAPEIQLVHILSHLTELEKYLCETPWDLLLMDDTFPKIGDISRSVNYVRMRSPQTAIVILSQRLNVAYINQLFFEGVRGFVYKEEQLEDILLPSIRRIMQGDLYVSPKVSVMMLQNAAQPELGSLTPRDIRVLQLLRDDLTIKEIGDTLGLDLQCVYRSRNRLRDVLGVRTNENIVSTAREKGLL